jgi:2-polyprenyl-6-methoxyphenol hydroxylase-like FAD-dependent oxidoreductase
VPVLIAGGGPTGLALAIGLGQLGVRCEVVDARPAPTRVPRAGRCGARAMEIFRRLGISGRLRAAGLPGEAPLDVVICAGSLARPLTRHRYPSVADALATTLEVNDGTMPLEPHVILSQYTLEPLLREVAEETPGVTVRFGAELIDFAATGGGVTAMVHTATRLRAIRADYLIGCDGAGSTVRRVLGVELRGERREPLRQALIYCPDLYERLPGGPAARAIQYHVTGGHPCTLIVQDDTQHFALQAPPGGPPLATMFEAVAGAVCQPLSYKVVHEDEWPQQLLLADRYTDDRTRVLLAGDAAHPASTTGGLGLSTAIGDTADLAWKLAATQHGWGGPALLASYEAERRPVAAQAITASFVSAVAEEPWSVDLRDVELGYRYTGSPVISHAGGTQPTGFAPTTWPGARLPHLWLDDGNPLHDVLGNCFTLLRVPGAGAAGATADRVDGEFARELAAEFGRFGAPLDLVEVTSVAAQAVYAGHRLILVRPDLHVAWRSGDSQPPPATLARLVTGNASP